MCLSIRWACSNQSACSGSKCRAAARAHFPTNVEQCQSTMREIASEVSHQYSVGYYPNNSKRDGKWRNIQVVTGQGEGKARLTARTRAGYYAPKGNEMNGP